MIVNTTFIVGMRENVLGVVIFMKHRLFLIKREANTTLDGLTVILKVSAISPIPAAHSKVNQRRSL